MTFLTHFSANIIPTLPKRHWSPRHTKQPYRWHHSPLSDKPILLSILALASNKGQLFHCVSISTISLALPLILPTFTVPKWIQLFSAGLPPWSGVACTNNSLIFEIAFIQYWSIKFYSHVFPGTNPLSAQETKYFYLRHHLTRKHIKQKQHATCQALHQCQKQGKGFKVPNTHLMSEPF